MLRNVDMRLRMEIKSSNWQVPQGRRFLRLEYHIPLTWAVLSTRSAWALRYCSSWMSCSPLLKSMSSWSLLEDMMWRIVCKRLANLLTEVTSRTHLSPSVESSQICNQYWNAIHLVTISTDFYFLCEVDPIWMKTPSRWLANICLVILTKESRSGASPSIISWNLCCTNFYHIYIVTEH